VVLILWLGWKVFSPYVKAYLEKRERRKNLKKLLWERLKYTP
jgi:hypothetical protein